MKDIDSNDKPIVKAIIIDMGDEGEIDVTLDHAKKLYEELDKFFGEKQINRPCRPYTEPWREPYTQPWPIITYYCS